MPESNEPESNAPEPRPRPTTLEARLDYLENRLQDFKFTDEELAAYDAVTSKLRKIFKRCFPN
jgi:hypothetical protein